MQKKPAVPVIVGMGERIVLKKYSGRQAQLAAAFKDKIPVEEGSPLEEMNEVILFYKTYYGIKFPPQVLIDGPSLRYLASNGISLADVAKVVGTTRNSVCTTSCVFGEIKKSGEDMEGALGLASGLKFAYCGHQGFEAGHVCYESVLREGQHIGTSLESGLLENSPMMEGVPFIIARDKQLIMKPPSETLINSKEMPHSEKTQLLALAKSQNEKDHQAGKKRSAKKDEVGSFSKKMKYAKK